MSPIIVLVLILIIHTGIDLGNIVINSSSLSNSITFGQDISLNVSLFTALQQFQTTVNMTISKFIYSSKCFYSSDHTSTNIIEISNAPD